MKTDTAARGPLNDIQSALDELDATLLDCYIGPTAMDDHLMAKINAKLLPLRKALFWAQTELSILEDSIPTF